MRGAVRLALLASVLLAVAPGASAAVDLAGTWYVLIHYRDDTSHDPKQLRWDDRIWTFERKGKDLEWKEYPIVVFQDESGRFERLGTNRQSRIVGPWEPNPAQLAQIASGLEYNTRGGKQKTLRGSDAAGWSSGGGSKSQSASVISYVETWSIENVQSIPLFVRLDSMGTSEDDVAEGRTQYATERIENDGAVLRGSFERDGTRHGTFTMFRSGDASITKGSGKTQEERLREYFAGLGGLDLSGIKTGEPLPPEMQQELRQEIRSKVEAALTRNGANPAEFQAQIDETVERIEKMVLEGKSQAEIDRVLRGDRLDP